MSLHSIQAMKPTTFKRSLFFNRTPFGPPPVTRLIFLMFTVLGVMSCVSNKDKDRQIQTYDDITLHQADETTRFNYTLYWVLPRFEGEQTRGRRLSQGDKAQQMILQQMRSRNAELSTVSLDGKTKVRLEDIAVEKLDRKLALRGVCSQGHTIEQTFWQTRSIKLLGQCL